MVHRRLVSMGEFSARLGSDERQVLGGAKRASRPPSWAMATAKEMDLSGPGRGEASDVVRGNASARGGPTNARTSNSARRRFQR